MTTGDRLLALSGSTGSAGALLLLIGSGTIAGDILVDYSQLPTGSASEHLLVDRATRRFTIRGTSTITKTIRGSTPL